MQTLHRRKDGLLNVGLQPTAVIYLIHHRQHGPVSISRSMARGHGGRHKVGGAEMGHVAGVGARER